MIEEAYEGFQLHTFLSPTAPRGLVGARAVMFVGCHRNAQVSQTRSNMASDSAHNVVSVVGR